MKPVSEEQMKAEERAKAWRAREEEELGIRVSLSLSILERRPIGWSLS